MKIYFFRHAQTVWNQLNRIQGSMDIELSTLGEQQANELANYLLHHRIEFAKLYSSTHKRALKTAEIIADRMNIPVVKSDALREINLGEWEGNTWKEVSTKYYPQFSHWLNNRRFTFPHGGESYQMLLERVIPEIELMIQNNTEDIGVVTHSAVIMCMRCLINHTAFEEMNQYKMPNLAMYEFDVQLFERVKSRLYIQ